jgi:hypothetical protein
MILRVELIVLSHFSICKVFVWHIVLNYSLKIQEKYLNYRVGTLEAERREV